MPIGDNQINLTHPAIAQVFLGTGAQGQYFSAALQIHSQRR